MPASPSRMWRLSGDSRSIDSQSARASRRTSRASSRTDAEQDAADLLPHPDQDDPGGGILADHRHQPVGLLQEGANLLDATAPQVRIPGRLVSEEGGQDIQHPLVVVHRRVDPFPMGFAPPSLPLDPDEPQRQRQHQARHQAGHQRPASTAPPEPGGRAHGPRLHRHAEEVSPQVVGQGRGGRVAVAGLPGDGLPADGLQVAGDGAVVPSGRGRLLVADLRHQRAGAAAERHGAGQQLVQDDPQAVDVAAGIDPVGFPPRLLGRHVGRGPQHLAFDRQGGFARGRAGRGRSRRGAAALRGPAGCSRA